MRDRRNARESNALARLGTAGLSAITLTGVAGWLVLASRPAQVALLAHVLAGVLLVVPATLYVLRHAAVRRAREAGASLVVARLATLATLVALATGIAVAVAHAAGASVGERLVAAHVAAAAAMLLALPVHLVPAWRTRGARAEPARRGAGLVGALGAPALLGAFAALAVYGFSPLEPVPEDYPRVAGEGPFAPARLETVHGGLVSARAMVGSERCGDCHAQIFEEWSSGVHRFSGMENPLVALAVRSSEDKRGLVAARFCGTCHEPVALLSGAIRESVFEIPEETREQGVGCLICHGVREVPGIEGNGQMLYAPPDTFVGFGGGPAASALNRVLIRSRSEDHRRAMRPPVLSQSQHCTSCHTVNAPTELNGFGFLKLHNENDDWGLSTYSKPGVGGAPVIGCQDCHMPLVDGSTDPVAHRRGGRHRSHRFPAANTFVAAHLGGAVQLEVTERYLRGESFPPAELSRWIPAGPVVSLHLEVPERVAPATELEVAAVLSNVKVGHSFPSGPTEVHETWIELVVRDGEGATLLESGVLDERGHRPTDSFALIAVPEDGDGNEVFVTGSLAAGFRYKNGMLHGYGERARYVVALPDGVRGPLSVEARLRYRKADGPFIDLLEGIEAADVPITDLASDARQVAVAVDGEAS